jgi:hypothetical protein
MNAPPARMISHMLTMIREPTAQRQRAGAIRRAGRAGGIYAVGLRTATQIDKFADFADHEQARCAAKTA